MSSTRLDLAAIEASLRDVQAHFEEINASLTTPADPMGDRVVENLLAGYEYLDELLADESYLLARGNSRRLLQLNCLVLGATATPGPWVARGVPPDRGAFLRRWQPGRPARPHELCGRAQGRRDLEARRRAYIQILSAPQLFVEGNHRTGALIMSHLLTRAGKPPFVLTVRNAKAYFDPSSLVKACRKRSIQALLEVPKLRKRLAKFVEYEADPAFLLRQPAMARAPGKLKASG